MIVFLKVKGENQNFETYKLGHILAFLVYTMGQSYNLNLYFSDIQSYSK